MHNIILNAISKNTMGYIYSCLVTCLVFSSAYLTSAQLTLVMCHGSISIYCFFIDIIHFLLNQLQIIIFPAYARIRLPAKCATVFEAKIIILSWLHLKRSSVQIAETLRITWALLFWPTWSAAVDRTLLLDQFLSGAH